MTNGKLYAGIVTMAVVGSAVSMLMSNTPSQRKIKTAKKNVGKTIKTVGSIVDSFM